MTRTTVLVVDDWSGWEQLVPSWNIERFDVEVRFARTVDEAKQFFNGEATATLVFISGLAGAREFIKDLRRRFSRLKILGHDEVRDRSLSDIGCNYFVNRQTLGLSLACQLQY